MNILHTEITAAGQIVRLQPSHRFLQEMSACLFNLKLQQSIVSILTVNHMTKDNSVAHSDEPRDNDHSALHLNGAFYPF